MKNAIVAGTLTVVAFSATTVAAQSLETNGGIIETLKPIYTAVTSGNYVLAAALGLVLVCALIKRYGVSRFPVLGTDVGGTALVLATSFGGAIASALAGGSAVFTGALAVAALKVALTAAGGYTMIKRLLIVPLIQPLAARAPAWARPLFDIALWVFDRQTSAKVAGDAAVKANPPTGAAGVVGDVEKL